MTRATTGLSPVQATDSWFIHHGLPYFVPEQRAAAREALRPRRIVPIAVAVGVAAAGVAVVLSWLVGDLSLGAAGLSVIGVLATGFYAVTALRGRPILTWAVSRTMSSLHLLLPMVTRALPLLLLFVTFLCVNAEVWQVAASLDGGVLWLTVLMFAVMALVFLLSRLPEELDGTEGQIDAERLRRACRGTPLGGEVEALIRRGIDQGQGTGLEMVLETGDVRVQVGRRGWHTPLRLAAEPVGGAGAGLDPPRGVLRPLLHGRRADRRDLPRAVLHRGERPSWTGPSASVRPISPCASARPPRRAPAGPRRRATPAPFR